MMQFHLISTRQESQGPKGSDPGAFLKGASEISLPRVKRLAVWLQVITALLFPLATASRSGEPRKPELVIQDGPASSVKSVAINSDGTLIASGGDDGVKLWEIESGRLVRDLDGSSSAAVAFSPDGMWVASDGHEEVSLWDVGTGRKVKSLRGHSTSFGCLAFSPDGKVIATTAEDKDDEGSEKV